MNDIALSPVADLAFLASGGELGALMRAHDWSTSPLGWPSDWPQSLRSVVGLLLGSKFPMFVAWGPELGFLYNDAYAEVLGAKHPAALGRRFHDIWSEIWPDISPLIDAALSGQATYRENLPLLMRRKGFDEQTWFTFSYSPVRDESGRVAGMFCACTETTDRVLAEQRTASERERLARMFEQAPSFMAMLRGPEHVFELVNAAYMQLIGHRDVLGQRVRDVLPEIEGQGFFELLDQVHATGEPFVGRALPADLQRRPGSPIERRFIDLVYQPITDGAGKVTGIFVEGSDVTDRVQSEAALAEQERELRTLTDTLPVLVSYVDAERRYRFVNKVYEAWFPRKREDIVGKPVWEVIGDAAYAGIVHHIDDALRGERVAFSQFMPYADIAGRHIEVEYIPRRAADGSVEGFYALVQDVTARRAAEEALRQSEAQFRAFTQAVPNHVWAARADGTLYWFNDQVYAYTGEQPGSLDGATWLRVLHPDDGPATSSAWSAAVADGQIYMSEFRVRRADGSYRWFLARAEPFHDESGAVTGWVGTNTDIHDRRQAEAELRFLNDTLEAQVTERTAERDRAWRLSQDILAAVAPDGVITALNASWTRLLGWQVSESVGLRFATLTHPEDLEETLRVFESVFEAPLSTPYEFRLRHRDGSYRWFAWTAAFEDSRVYASGRDVTAEKERQTELAAAQEQLRQSQKMEAMGQLTGGVAHDFNNLLTPIVAVLDRLRRRSSGDEREQRLIQGAAQSAERARTLVQRLLAFARRQPLQPTAVDVGALLQGMADLVASTTGPQIRVAVDVAPDLPPARSDANQLEMAILNLAVNARDAMPEGGTLRLSAGADAVRGAEAARLNLPPGRYVRLSVADTGTGMDEATLARAVEPFFSTKGIGKGTGLGLSMVHGFVSQLGGAIEIRSRLGLGTHVELWLPESRDAAGATPESQAPQPKMRRGTAVLVDDEEAVRLSTADMLGELGYRVVEVASAEEALRLVEGGMPLDLLVTDHLMAGINGSDLARRLKALRPGLPVLIISGYAESEGIEPDLPRLSKPFRKDELELALTESMSVSSV